MSESVKSEENRDLELSKQTFDKILKICLIAGIIFVSGFIIYYILNPEPGYVTFGLLNSEQKAENYPTNASVNEEIEFYVLVENHLGGDFTFRLKIKKGDNQTIMSPDSETRNAELNHTTDPIFLVNEQRWISNFTVSFLTIGANQTIIVELWQITNSIDEKFYDVLWLRLNITTA